jgi:hypothetical protein
LLISNATAIAMTRLYQLCALSFCIFLNMLRPANAVGVKTFYLIVYSEVCSLDSSPESSFVSDDHGMLLSSDRNIRLRFQLHHLF